MAVDRHVHTRQCNIYGQIGYLIFILFRNGCPTTQIDSYIITTKPIGKMGYVEYHEIAKRRIKHYRFYYINFYYTCDVA